MSLTNRVAGADRYLDTVVLVKKTLFLFTQKLYKGDNGQDYLARENFFKIEPLVKECEACRTALCICKMQKIAYAN